MMLEEAELKQVENFVYLGVTVLADQSRDKDSEQRIGVALWGIWTKYARPGILPKKNKVMLYHTLVPAIVLYNADMDLEGKTQTEAKGLPLSLIHISEPRD